MMRAMVFGADAGLCFEAVGGWGVAVDSDSDGRLCQCAPGGRLCHRGMRMSEECGDGDGDD